jgi:hypothetical protein
MNRGESSVVVIVVFGGVMRDYTAGQAGCQQ